MSGDGYGRLISKAIWSGSQKQKISYEYDTDSNLSRQIYPDGGYIEYDYRELSTNWNGDLYYYNTGDLLCQIYDRRNWGDNPYGVAGVDYTDPNTPAPTYSFAYYADSGNLKSYTMPDGIRIEYGYDQALNAKTSVEVFREEERIYYQNYEYNQLGQLSALTYLNDPNSFDLPEPLAELFYDDNGNREFMYYDQIPIGAVGEKFRIQYGYNSNNYLTSINSLVYTLDGVAVDGLGRLKSCFESLNGIHHDNNYSYDMRSQLTYSKRKDITSTNPVCQPWTEEKLYHDKAGNIIRAEKVNSSDASNILGTNYGFNGDILTGATGADIWSLDNDANGNITSLAGSPNSTVTYNYDNKLKYASKGSDTISVKYDPMGNRIVKHSVLNGISRNQRFIVDINSDLPVVLCVLDCSDTGGAGSGQDLPSSLEKLYYHVGAQVIAQKEAGADGELFYYVHDRLGSVRAVVDIDMLTVNEYSYDSFGKMYQEECYEAIDSGTGQFIAENPFKYTGQYYDTEIGQYYLRARMYDPQMRRFTGRDPIRGNVSESMTLHRYLYCMNNPTNGVDVNGKLTQAATILIRGLVGGVINAYSNYSSASDGNGFKAAVTGFFLGAISGIAEDPLVALAISAGTAFVNSYAMSKYENDNGYEMAGRYAGSGVGFLAGGITSIFAGSGNAGVVINAGANIFGNLLGDDFASMFVGIVEWWNKSVQSRTDAINQSGRSR